MYRVLELVLALLLVVLLFVVVGLILPAERSLTHQAETNRPRPIVFDVLNSFHRFADWHPVRQRDPNATINVSGAEYGEGARVEFDSRRRDVNRGSWEIVESEPHERLVYDIQNDARGNHKTLRIDLRPVGRGGRNVEITQTYTVDYGYNLFGRFAGMYLDRTVGRDMQRSLRNLSNLLSTIPRFDYSVLEQPIQIVDVAARNVLLVETNAPRTSEGIQTALDNNLQWIQRVMDSNDLEPDGPLRLVTTEYGAENYAFDLVQPVRPEGSGPEAPAEEDNGQDVVEVENGELEDEGPQQIVLPPRWAGEEGAGELPDLGDIELLGPVQFSRSYEGRAVATAVVSHPAGLPAVRDQLRAWLLVRGEQTQGRPFDEYLLGPDDSFAADGQFVVYWPLSTPGQPDWEPPAPAVEDEDEENGEADDGNGG